MLDFLDVFDASSCRKARGAGLFNAMGRMLGLTLIAIFFAATLIVVR